MAHEYDVAIVGAGTAGLAALREVRKRTDNFVIINGGPYGTTCARVGCMPSKALIEAARAFHRRKALDEFGIRGGDALTADLPAVLGRVRRLRDQFVQSTLKATDDLGPRNIAGVARLTAPDRLTVNGREIRARRIIIATGARPVCPEPWRSLGDRVITTDELFEMKDLPPRMAVIGLGAVGLEMAQALARLGVEVTAVGSGNTLGGLSDPEVHDAAASALSADFTMHYDLRAALEPAGAGVRVRDAGGSDRLDVVVDMVLAATGRRPNLEALGFDALGVALDGRGMPPYNPQTLQVGDLPLFIAGDVNDRRPLLHEAADDGHIAGRNATAATVDCYERRTELSIIFTDPEIAIVGKRQDGPGQGIHVGSMYLEHQSRARMAANSEGMLRVYANGDGHLIGAELCSADAAHMAHLLVLGVQQSMTVRDFLRLPFYHPTIEEGLRSALRSLARQLPEGAAESDLSRCDDFGIEALD